MLRPHLNNGHARGLLRQMVGQKLTFGIVGAGKEITGTLDDVGEDYVCVDDNGKKAWIFIHHLTGFQEADEEETNDQKQN